ncbi:MarR family transcriptional regulator [Candidatus Acidianus copahuensis]|uniref:MarR family transcriptional regulator n=2 Tax=Sulfolobaceae TaxID=118883 RepID=A0A031LPJ1_9CREN|nr:MULTISPECIES: helix-turn-helix domain-containing protein [Acidianus]EZQ04733.1 MarR family transcriptional regulator [Candidatus Acidianus copahuensis]NON63135.1 MarR family transcriptional regulator [Acidianus sp. RZ1]
MNIEQLTVLTNLAEGELSVNELTEYTGLAKRKLIKIVKYLEMRGYIEKRAFIGKDVIFSITDLGFSELYKHYIYMRKLIDDMEFTVCSKFDC